MPFKEGVRFGKYTIERLLGRGGCGEVWLARDPTLGRPVALKFMKESTGDDAARFDREARLAATLDHPNIAAIYEAAETDGVRYIAMQYVDGVTLRSLPRADLREQARLVRDMARAVAFANERGVIHRDLKPENVMVAAGRCFVMDFGLARPVRGGDTTPTLTQSGMAVGTPAYMSPEQARGARADARSDVYGVGATLYERLTGRPPFDGGDLYSTLMKVIDEDPVEPRRLTPSVPAELEAIALKCLEKDPARRYATASDVADDLDRFLKGDPVLARRRSAREKLARAAGRRKPVLAIVGIAAMLVAAVAAIVWSRTGRAEESREQVIARLRATADACLRSALDLRRVGNLEGMGRYAAELDKACDEALARDPSLAEAHYLRGRMERARFREAEAMACQQKALAIAPAHAGARYERLVLNTRLLMERVQGLSGAFWKAQSRSKEPIASNVVENAVQRDPAAAALVAAIQEDAGHVTEEPAAACARGFRSYALMKGLEALPDLRAAATAGIEEAIETVAALDYDITRTQAAFDASIAGITRAIDGNRGYLPFREVRARLSAHQSRNAGAQTEDLVRRALADIDAVLAAMPDRWSARLLRVEILVNRCEGVRQRGGAEALPFAETALGELGVLLAARPGEPRLHMMRAGVLMLKSQLLGSDAALREQARESARKGCAGDAFDHNAWLMLANVLIDDLVAAGMEGAPVDEIANAALEAVAKAAELNPFAPDTPMARGRIHNNVAISHRLSGRETAAVESFRKAMEAFDRAVLLDGEFAEALAHRAYARARIAAGAYSEENAAEGEKAVADATAALERSPGNVIAVEARGMARVNLAAYRQIRGADPIPLYRDGIADYEASAAVERPEKGRTLADLAAARLNYAAYLAGLGKDARAALEAAMGDFDRAIALDRRNAVAWSGRAQARLVLAEVRQDADGYRKAIEDAAEAIAIDARRAAGWSARASARRRLGDLRIQLAPDEAAELYREAVKDADEAVQRTPGDLSAVFERAAARDHLGLTMHMRNEDATEEYEAAVKDYRVLLKAVPGRADVLMMHGAACANLGGWLERRQGDAEAAYREGIASFEAVLKVQPGNAQVKQYLQGTKAALAEWLKRKPRD